MSNLNLLDELFNILFKEYISSKSEILFINYVQTRYVLAYFILFPDDFDLLKRTEIYFPGDTAIPNKTLVCFGVDE